MGSHKKRKERQEAKQKARKAKLAPVVAGVYPVDGVPDCYLVELLAPAPMTPLDPGKLGQRDPERRARMGETAWDLRLLDPQGKRSIAEEADLDGHPEVWDADLRLAFFLHDLEPGFALETPWGPLKVPAPTPWPARLDWLAYEPRL